MSKNLLFEIQRELEKANYPTPLPLAKEILEFTQGNKKQTHKILKQISKNKPWEHIRGYTYFKKHKIFLNENVLIPRVETEEMVDIAKGKIQEEDQIFDIGTGSGCIAIALSKIFPKNKIFATDISKKAYEVAKKNIEYHNCKNIEIYNTNLLEFSFENKKPTVIVSNLPYIPSKDIENLDPSVKDFEPKIALDGGKEGYIYYKELMEQIKEKKVNLKFGVFEIEPSIKNFFLEKNFKIVKDSYGKERFVTIHQTLLG